MFINPVLFPQVSNREDLYRTVGLFDDDTNEAIDVSGRVLAAPGDFTAANWVVTAGDVVTASVTQLTRRSCRRCWRCSRAGRPNSWSAAATS
uniref:hypothetical protein n=1 Tax=Pseudomonas sp. EL_65y_Pfl1_R83 TaxID=3088697 RepID=UPI0030D8589B